MSGTPMPGLVGLNPAGNGDVRVARDTGGARCDVICVNVGTGEHGDIGETGSDELNVGLCGGG